MVPLVAKSLTHVAGGGFRGLPLVDFQRFWRACLRLWTRCWRACHTGNACNDTVLQRRPGHAADESTA
ncbi:hypothetical protein WJX72_007202 [[Myrmecia] bisecta]|uniref:Uncharacterized protein n=1 Tax=[Myrmecia] bisecta TaxID=41462 RepID=A0AAW1QS50_9CHLO